MSAERSPLGVQEFGASSLSNQSLSFNSPTPMRLTRRDGTGRGLDAYRETWMQIEPVYAPQPYVPPPKVERTGPQITPLYPGLPESLSPSKRTHMAAAQPGSPQHRAMQAQQRQQQSPLRSPSSQNRFLKGQSVPRSYAYNHLPSYHTEVYDPSLPMPTVVIHKTAKDSFNKNSNMRKHRGESRNVLGGMYTS